MAKKDLGKIARRTLNAARFFFEQAGRVETHSIEYYGYYIEATVVFAWMVLEHLEREFSEKRGAKKWIKNLEENRLLIKDLKQKRNSLSHESPRGITLSQNDSFYLETSLDEASPEAKVTYEMLLNQLDEVEVIIDECEKRFK